ncbi:molybdopterin-dependent oxidoreductase [Rhizobiaceae bacterium n13]|uniref:Molybdopterin-dependent oxidoreductase n=1 Tax=Ferirhizobium litorale TaxID=2927786 RepID=A0AAE3U304_9HYPH|nr:molybdopterin-dependent oxidoreductase [Fererhizobium litorale]MDI7861820.1 molybdopterin-dependent oxidoreductase [Fererhizobium litorale]MDI7921838.1 molybdopterin-dependent oxidoreductase [Fererhizobium litorale]
MLEVKGKLKISNRGPSAMFDLAMLEGLGLKVVKTSTVWTDGGPHLFEGVLARDVLAAVGAQDAHTVIVRALNDYAIEIPVSDFYDHDVILAMRMDGRQLTARDKGPLWIVYPRDDHPELQDERVDQRWVWQVKELEVD